MHRERTVVLTYPPCSSVWHLPIGIAYLTALLQQRGHHVIQRYAHISGAEFVLRRHGGPEVDRALSTVRSPDSSILERYDARMTFERVSRSVPTADTFAVERNNVRYDSSQFKGDIGQLHDILRHPEQHLFYQYLISEEIPRAVAARPWLYGISVADERQVVSACVLASLVKQALPGTLVVMGGNYWARVLDAYADPGFAALFDHWDAIVYAEGFQPIVALAEGIPPAQVPGVVWRDGERVRCNPRPAVPTEYEDLPTPVFEPSARQWSPEVVPPLYTMSNCPMQCSFCSIAAGSDTFLGKPRAMSERRIAEHMAALGASRFDIQDEFLPIARQLRLGRELAAIGHRATWQCYLTVSDKLLDLRVCEALREAGCRAVQLGLESLNPGILRQEAKVWNHPASYGRILKNLHDVGIQVHAFIIVGVPNEPINWNLRWLAFLEDYGDYLLTIKSSRYRLTRRAPDERLARAGKLGGVRISEQDQLPLNLNRDQFSYTAPGLSRKKVEAIRDLLEEACHRHWAYQVTSTLPWWINRGRYTLDELRAMGRLLAAERPAEPSVPASHIKRGLSKVSSALWDELRQRVRLGTFEDACRTSRELLRADLAA